MPPKKQSSVPFLNFASLDNVLVRPKKSAADFDGALTRATRPGAASNDGQLNRLNGILRGIEQTLTHPQGLAGREWYRHMIYAPGLFTGYGVKTLPGICEAIEGHWQDVDQNMAIVAGALDAYSRRFNEAKAP